MLSIAALDHCKDIGVIILSVTPHCSHKRRHLDSSVYEPMKTNANLVCGSWTTNDPERTMAMYDLPGIINTSSNFATSSENAEA
jgi:hypothetical protein